jgi:UDP-3-O-[3-hydroxymyristoyl] glucosamine N-acyltransferase
MNISRLTQLMKAHVANESFVHALLPSLELTSVAPLAEAGPTDIAFFFSKHYQADLLRSNAGVIITGTAFEAAIAAANPPQWQKSVFLACADPYLAMALVSAEFSKTLSKHDHQVATTESKIHPTAVVHATARLGRNITLGAFAVIEENAVIANDAVIYPHCYVGANSYVGEGTVLFPQVTLYEKTILGKRCRIHAGVVLGADGFGYAPVIDENTKLPVNHQKIYHLGRVVIGDDVEIGANSTIDRGTLGDTRIFSKVKIDNLVQIGHNCEVGEGSILCGCAGMAGSSSLGKFVLVGAQSGTGNQVHVGDYAKLGAYTGAAKDVEPKAEMGGMPARPIADLYKIFAIQNKLLKQRGKKS